MRYRRREIEVDKIMDWVPIVFVTFKLLALGTGMFFAVKWHYDQTVHERHAVLRAAGLMAGAFGLVLLTVGFFAFSLSRMLGLDLGF